MTKQVKLLEATSSALDELVRLRKEKTPHLVPKKQDIVAELIMAGLKKESKK